MANDVEVIADAVIAVINNDPECVNDMVEDYKFMEQAGALMGDTREQIMAEFAVAAFKTAGEKRYPDITLLLTDTEPGGFEDQVIERVRAYIETKGL